MGSRVKQSLKKRSKGHREVALKLRKRKSKLKGLRKRHQSRSKKTAGGTGK